MTLRDVLSEMAAGESVADALNQEFDAALKLFIGQCGGDLERASIEQKDAFSAALAAWVLDYIEAL